MSADKAWWKGAVVYQIYPRSFADSDGDGIGDLEGVLSKLDYIAGLGVDAIWLSPIHPSPNRDFGYDVADFTGVAKQMGGMRAFDALVAEAHRLRLKVILDEVLSHTSDLHPWFAESLKGAKGDKADWYVWADPKDDGTAPNNWLSVFGGPAWSYQPSRRQYYFHKFLRQQPKLNLRNEAALEAALDVLRFWFDRGVDGFRLDVANSFLHDDRLRDNPAIPPNERTAHHWAHAPNMQRRIRDSNLPENRSVLDRIRTVAGEYHGSFVFGEFSEEPQLLGEFAGADHGLHSGYTFTFLEDRSFAPKTFAEQYAFLNGIEGLWPCVTFSNHDVPRTVTRYGGGSGDDALAKLALLLLMSLRGTVLLYQGEELGLGDGPIAREEIRDPVGELYYPYHKGRDPCRTPMPWRARGANLGFSDAKPWLPMAPAHKAQAVDVQDKNKDSVLNFARRLIRVRKDLPALRTGELKPVAATEAILAFERMDEGQRILCVFNLSSSPAEFDLGAAARWPTLTLGTGEAKRDGATLRLGPRSAYLAQAPSS